MALTLAGCGSDKKAEEVVPTVAPTATPTIPPVTATPAPTSTPAPRKIGEKTSQSKFVYLTNNLKTDVRELYLMVSGSEDWGDNLIPREFSVKASDQVQMFYTPESVQVSAEEEDSEETGAPSGALYDMKLVTADGNTYEIYSIELSDMEKASLTLDEETSTAYLRYIRDPEYIPISIDRRTLVENSNVINKDGLERYNQFSCRIPGTYGKNEKQLVIPDEQVFRKTNGSYIAFLRKDEAPFVFDVVTKQVDHEIRKLTGEEFVKQYFDEVDKTAENKVTSLQKYKAKSKDLSDLKVKMPTPPIKSK